MQLGDTKSFKKAVMAFFLVGGILMAANFGAHYFGRYGFSVAPFFQKSDSLWWLFYDDACHSVGGAVAAAVTAFIVARSIRDEK
jgi:hypothetical protein